MEARVRSALLVDALLRLAGREGGFGAVLARGDAESGAVTVIVAERGERKLVLDRIVQPDGHYAWQETGNRAAADEEEFRKFLAKRCRFDPDLWLIELDVASAERFAAEMAALN